MSVILYGIGDNYINVTKKCVDASKNKDFIEIPRTDIERAAIFGDPLLGTVKKIMLLHPYGARYYFDQGMVLKLAKNELSTNATKKPVINFNISIPADRLADVQNRITMDYGFIREEGVEQLMSVMFIRPHDQVLELGSNVGRNSIVIASILDNDRNLVTLESAPETVKKLQWNKMLNYMNFNVENAALTKQKLIQNPNTWQTTPSDDVPEGFYQVSSITVDQLYDKYKLDFTVLVADCEGSLYYILQEFPEILQKNIKTLIVENDYHEFSHKEFVDQQFQKNGFHRVFFQGGGWGPCADFFWEVWQKV